MANRMGDNDALSIHWRSSSMMAKVLCWVMELNKSMSKLEKLRCFSVFLLGDEGALL